MEGKKGKKALRQQQPPRQRRCRQPQGEDEDFMTEGDFTTVINIGDDANTEEDEGDYSDLDEDGDHGQTPEQQARTSLKFAFDTDLERQERELFGTVDRSKRNQLSVLLSKIERRPLSSLLSEHM